MAVDRKQFINNVDKCLKANATFTKFYMNFKIDGKVIQKVLDFSDKSWDKRTRISKAKSELIEYKEKIINSSVNFNENTYLDDLAEIYFETACDPNADWTKERKNIYRLYCQEAIGKKRIKNIRQVDIDALRKQMETKGRSKQTKNGCSPRTIKKVLVQTLRPILQYAVENKVLQDIPNIKAPKANNKKKIVQDAGMKLATLYKVIVEMYADDPFYRGLFLFALYGRRWNEIRTLKWSDVDFQRARYTIRAENNKIGIDQTYELSNPIAQALYELNNEKEGLVFKSPITGYELYTPKKQLEHIKTKAQIPELTMHYFRHILVSAMGEMGTATTVLSASLGHTNLDTVNTFYLSANHTKASGIANQAIEAITAAQM